MKSHAKAGQSLFQIVLMDYAKRQPPPAHVLNSGNIFKRYNEIDDYIPKKTVFRWAKDSKRAKRKVGKKLGTIIACFKVNSHEARLHMIEKLSIDKPITIEMTPEEFTVGRNLEISPRRKTIEIDIDKE